MLGLRLQNRTSLKMDDLIITTRTQLACKMLKICDSKISKKTLEGLPRENLFLSKKSMIAQLRFAKQHLNEPQDFSDNVQNGQRPISRMQQWTDGIKPPHLVKAKHLIRTVSTEVMIWACSTATGPGYLAVTELTEHQSIVVSSFWKLKLCAMKQNSDPKHSSKSPAK